MSNRIVKYGNDYIFTGGVWFETVKADEQSVNIHYDKIRFYAKANGKISEDELDEIDYEYDDCLRLIDEFFDPCHDENIYGLPGIEQSIREEGRA